ncbi:hypothetical protein CHLNCDRAFT_139946 [Chlorella variabilis]|uniref:Kinesin-associated 3 n=1 Tax=Chlorella variabilis TaxID=554065 RepID=E1ZR95_CHLVA|nr:hypothetical protein CHLNCDRAFT_139946 [Chlorella variabilis]EFN51738.1 hypothetical protein CHLNCDRAFT_139946 [Chlorella variabilis]|eukprot:XP_005843840.1 hypothetical protein CHLNCDRAFT_139946 [Chlorella variabilis]
MCKQGLDSKELTRSCGSGVRPGKLELAADGCALEVHYESVEVAVLPNGQEVPQTTKQGVKRIKFELPEEDSGLPQLARQIVDGCKLLHPQRVDEVGALLAAAAAARRMAAPQPPPDAAQPAASLDARHRVSDLDRQLLREEQLRYLEAAGASATQALAAAAATASIDQLEAYLEALYDEELGPKTAAAAAIALLFRDPRSLGALQAHPTLLQALARLLREDAKRSAELGLSLLMSFFALSHLPQAHALLVQNQVGSLTMELLDLELRRAAHWQQREGVGVAGVGAALLAARPLAAREQRLALALARQEPLLYAGLSLLLNMAEDAGVEQKMVKKGLLSLLVALLDRGAPRLLVLATTFLRKLSVYGENCAALRESGAVGQLAALVPPFPGSDGSSCAEGSAEGVSQLLPSVLRLLHNLSFDDAMRQQMVAAGLIAKVSALLRAPSAHTPSQQQQQGKEWVGKEGPQLPRLVLGLLYHLSLEAKNRSMFLYTDAIPSLHAMLTAAQPPLAATCPELAALSISLACSARVAEEMARGGRLEQLLDLAVGPAEPAPAPQQGLPEGAEAEGAQPAAALAEGGEAGGAQPPAAALPPLAAPAAAAGPLAEDELAWKLLRALGEHDSEPVRARFAPALPRMGRLVMAGSLPPAAFAEALGCLSCLDIPGYHYAQLLRDTQLHTFLADLLAGSDAVEQEQGDVALSAVQAVAVLCADEECAGMLVEALHGLMLERMDDERYVLATTAAAARLAAQAPTRAALLAHAELAARFAELLQHTCREVARAADAALDAVAAGSEEWAASVQRLKFEAHNREWLQIVSQT